MPQPDQVDQLSEAIRGVYRAAWEQVVAEQKAIADDPAAFRRRARLAEVRASIESAMDHVDTQSRVWLTDEFPRVYSLGGTTGARAAGAAFSWTVAHTDAVTVLANDLFDDLLKATTGVRRSTKAVLRQLARQQTASVIAGGRTAVQGGDLMAKLAEGRGIWSVRYSDGSLHGLDEYGQMAIRSKSAIAYNAGTVRGAEVEWFEIADGAGCGLDYHEDPETANGLIFNAEDALAHPISHPNCSRAFLPRPDITSAEEAANAKPTSTPEQQADQATVAAERETRVRNRAAARAHQDRLARRQEQLAARA